MAAKGKISSVLDQQAVQSEITFLEGKLTGILGQFKTIAVSIDDVNNKMKAANGGQSVNQTIQQQNVLVKSAANAMSEYDKAQKALNQTQERYNYLMNGGAKLEQQLYEARNRNKQKQAEIIAQNKQETKSIEEQIAAAKRQKNSIADVEAENKKLIAIKKQLNTDDKQQASALNQINARLDENTKYLKENGDAATKQRMNIGNYGDALTKVGGIISKVAGALGITAGLAGAMKVAGEVMKSTDALADQLDFEMSGLAQSVQKLFRNIASGDWSNLLNGMRDAYIEGKRYAELMDYIGNIGRERDIQNANIDLQIIELRGKARDKSLSSAERQAAIDQIILLGQQQLANNLKVTGATLNNELTNAANITGVQAGVVQDFMSNYDALYPSMQKGQKIIDDITKKYTTVTKTPYGSSVSFINTDAINKEIASLSKLEQSYVNYAKIESTLVDDSNRSTDRNKLTAALVANTQAKQAEAENRTSLVRMRNSLYNELMAEENSYNSASKKSHDEYLKDLLDAEKRYQESQINLIQDAETQEKARINLKYDNEVADLRAKNVLSTDLEASLLAERDKELTAITVKYATERAKKEQEALQKYYSEIESQIRFGGATNEAYNQLEQIQQLKDLAAKYGTDIAAATPEQSLAITEKYEQDKTEIVERYEKQRLEMAVKTLELLAGMFPEDLNIQKELLSAKIALNQAEVSAEEEKVKAKVDANKEGAKQISEIDKELYAKKWDIISQTYETLDSLVSSYYDKQAEKLNNQVELDEKAKGKELKQAEGNAELTEAINKKYDEIAAKREREKKEMALKEAKYEKLSALFSIGISTAKAIAEDLAGKKYLIPYDIAMGALQATAVAAKPLPRYFKGRKGGSAEFAYVGEQGTEGIRLKSGQIFATPDRETPTFLPEEADVIPHRDFINMLERSSITSIPTWNGGGFDGKKIDELKKSMAGNFKELQNTIKNKREFYFNVTKDGMYLIARNGSSETKYLDDNVRF